MDIIAASNIGMTNAYKDKKKKTKRIKVKQNKLYVLAEVAYTINGVLNNDSIVLTICNAEKLIDMAKEYYKERNLKCNKRWNTIDINNLKPKDAIKILTKRKYIHIGKINEDTIGEDLIKNKVAYLTSVDISDLQHKGV